MDMVADTCNVVGAFSIGTGWSAASRPKCKHGSVRPVDRGADAEGLLLFLVVKLAAAVPSTSQASLLFSHLAS